MLDNTAKIACCNICLLSTTMKVCQSCPLNPANLKLTSQEREQVQRQELLKPVKEI